MGGFAAGKEACQWEPSRVQEGHEKHPITMIVAQIVVRLALVPDVAPAVDTAVGICAAATHRGRRVPVGAIAPKPVAAHH